MSTDSERNALWIGGGKQLLVVDSDQEERDRLVRFLQKGGFTVFGVDTFDEAIAYMETRGIPHLVLMTMSSAGVDEFRQGRTLSRNGNIPVVVLSFLSEVTVVTQSIVEFADDFIRMPYNQVELLARIRRVLLRSAQPYAAKHRWRERIGEDFYIDFNSGDALVDDRHVLLTPTEVQIVKVLHNSSGKIVPYPEMMTAIWNMADDEHMNTLWVHVRRLRTKIEANPQLPRRLLTVRGVGYCLANYVSESAELSISEI